MDTMNSRLIMEVTQAIIAISSVIIVMYMVLIGQEVPEWLKAIASSIFSFYMGAKTAELRMHSHSKEGS